ncbi:MAG: hypothetical protein HYX55_04680 [Chloroflexi bacterium]|nr:hypothetical protein [Chloroflexota bacterium]
MARRLVSIVVVGMLAAACGTGQPSPSPAITVAPTVAAAPTPAPTPTPGPTATPKATGPFVGQAYALDLPAGWTTFDLKDPSGTAVLDAFVTANPEMAASIEAFKKLPNVTLAVNVLVGNVVVSLSLPTGGLTLDVLATSFTSQFAAVPGIKTPPVAENVTLPVGPAVHWDIKVEANKPGGGTYEVGESVYLVANDTTAVLVEFVVVGTAGVPQEDQIIKSLRFTP